MQLSVIKRNGVRVSYDGERIRRVVESACRDIKGVSPAAIVARAEVQIFDGIATAAILEILVKSAADLISEETPGYQYAAANLNIFKIRGIARGGKTPLSLYDHIRKMCDAKWYDPELLESYSREETEDFDKILNHDLDFNFSYAATKQLEGKYLIKNRVTGEILESPQTAFMCICMAIFRKFSEDKNERSDLVKALYRELSEHNISLPTPIMAGVRSPLRQFSSCVLLECGDSLDGICAVGTAVVNYVSRMAGIGINAGRIRAKGSPVRNGAVRHTGITPFLRFFQAAVQSCSAGGVRSGAATVYYPLWHLEIEDLLVLKNNRGTEENRARHMDYAVQINGYFYRRLQKGEDITLFSPHEVADMYEAFFKNQDRFAELYEKYESDELIKFKKKIKSTELFSLLMKERSGTGRIYIMNVDHCNTHSAFLEEAAPVRQSNLCCEVTLPTKPLSCEDREAGEVALCILGAVNVGNIGTDREKMRRCTKLLVYALDSLIDLQNYPMREAEKSARERRPLGIGIVNFAYFLAARDLKISSPESCAATHELFETLQYCCIEASVELAKIKGPCKKFNETKYSRGVLPIDTYYGKGIDKIVAKDSLKADWESLRAAVLKHGMRNSALTAVMPSETSSQVSNSTNGIEPPRALVSVKQSRDGVLKQVVPDIETLRDRYELLWDIKDNIGYLTNVGIMQKFTDQAISANTNYDPAKFEDGKVPLQIMLRDLLFAYSVGVKTLYYHNTRDGASEEQIVEETCSSGACRL
ncbi:MAG: ribonucleoside-diphosphate reductase subunit alpha [Holosporaceae bacterium]|jgi:ribonucleoside-diphosphate reductase alpha chain|nr:ribonucleoside-diphosphate reductase subunit alpha [Holosporaceae bacterium]